MNSTPPACVSVQLCVYIDRKKIDILCSFREKIHIKYDFLFKYLQLILFNNYNLNFQKRKGWAISVGYIETILTSCHYVGAFPPYLSYSYKPPTIHYINFKHIWGSGPLALKTTDLLTLGHDPHRALDTFVYVHFVSVNSQVVIGELIRLLSAMSDFQWYGWCLRGNGYVRVNMCSWLIRN